ncbi:MAG: DNA methyltransferase [Pseudomonadota bacterium]
MATPLFPDAMTPASPAVRQVHIGSHTLYLANAYELVPRLGCFDGMITDPPYKINVSGGGRFRAARQHTTEIGKRGLDRGFDLEILSWKFAYGIVCFCHNDQLGNVITRLNTGFHRHAVISWHKDNPMPVANKHYLPDTEFYVHAWQQGYAPIGELKDKARHITTAVGKSPFSHPTVKPDAVMDKILANVPGETICDPFMGTGSTGVAAIKAGRQFTGIEIDPEFFEIACQRIRTAVAKHEGFDGANA